MRPTHEEAYALQTREVAEAARQRVEKALEVRRKEVSGLVDGVLPKRGTAQ